MNNEETRTCHEELEPGVINSDMIVKSVLQNSPKGEMGRLIAEEGVVLEDIKDLRLEYLNILRIDHLWMLNALVKLHLSNNMIEKIENLERLEHLKELDISFNNIEKIENLDKLANLEVLTLFENKISELENMENLTSLMIFSIGNNQLRDLKNVRYLRPFENLRALNMVGNPVAGSDHFKDYVYAVLPQLVYYEYRMISPTEKEMANVRFKDDLKDLGAEEGKAKAKYVLTGKEKELVQLYTDAFVENMSDDSLFTDMFREDREGLAFLKMNESAEELFVEFKDKFLRACKELFGFGLAQHKQRQDEIDQYESAVGEAKNTIMSESRDLMNEFIEKKTKIFHQMREIASSLQYDTEGDGEETNEDDVANLRQMATEFQEMSHHIWQDLMRMEMNLYEQIEDVTSSFGVVIRELQEQFVEVSQSHFVQMREAEGWYFEHMSDLAVRYLNTINARVDDPTWDVPAELKSFVTSRDTMASALSGSHELHLQVIDDRQDTLTRRAAKWADDYVDKLRKDEITRNRGKIVEISHFMDLQQEEYDDILSATDVHIEEVLDLPDDEGLDAGEAAGLEEALERRATERAMRGRRSPDEEEESEEGEDEDEGEGQEDYEGEEEGEELFEHEEGGKGISKKGPEEFEEGDEEGEETQEEEGEKETVGVTDDATEHERKDSKRESLQLRDGAD